MGEAGDDGLEGDIRCGSFFEGFDLALFGVENILKVLGDEDGAGIKVGAYCLREGVEGWTCFIDLDRCEVAPNCDHAAS